VPFSHLVIDHVLGLGDRWIIGDSRGQVVAKILRYSDQGQNKGKGEEEFSHTNLLGVER
jgi:hypothetical protein